jgi:predicted  nucleic acid-binding Zn-ribbon protein
MQSCVVNKQLFEQSEGLEERENINNVEYWGKITTTATVKEMKIKDIEGITSTNANTTATHIRSRDVLHGQNQIIYPLSGLRKLLQLMSKMDTRLNSIEKKVTKSVDELDEIKTSIKSLTQKISTVEREVTTLKQQYPEID